METIGRLEKDGLLDAGVEILDCIDMDAWQALDIEAP